VRIDSKPKLTVALLFLIVLGGLILAYPAGQTILRESSKSGLFNVAPAGSSWNTAVTCQPVLVTVRDILGSQLSSNGGATFSGGYGVSIPDKRSINPPCNVNAKLMLVEIHSIVLIDFSAADECGDPGYSPPIPSVYCDSTGNIEDQNDHTFGSNYNMVRIHTENDMDWKYHSIAYPDAPMGVPIDVQGFVYWDPSHVSETWHSYSGWELHPLTAWRLSGQGQTLTASFLSSPSSPVVNTNVYFAGTATGGNPPYTYAWTFGDGSTGTGASPSHAYTTSDVFTVSLTITDSAGGSSQVSNGVTVSSPAPLVASYQYLPSTPLAAEMVTITASASGGQPGYSYAWQFGDGASSGGNPIGHSYTAPGSYVVILTATDSVGHKATFSETVSVLSSSPPPLDTYFVFANPSGVDLSSQVSWQVMDGSVQVAASSPALLDTTKTYVLNTFYQNRLVESRVFSPQPSVLIRVYMYPHQSATNGYVAFNSTINVFAITEQSGSRLRFTALSSDGTGASNYMIIAKVPKSPALVQKAGSDYPFSFDQSSNVVIIETTALSDWNLIFNSSPQPPPPPQLQPPGSQPQSHCQSCLNTRGPVYFLSLLALGAIVGLVLTLLVLTAGARRRLRRTRGTYYRRLLIE